MSETDSQDLSVVGEGGSIARNPQGELQSVVEQIAAKHHGVVQAAQKFGWTDAALATLSPEEQFIALEARKNRNEVAYGVLMAHDFVVSREKRKLQQGSTTLHIHAQDGSQVGVVLPPRQMETPLENVITIDANRLKAPEDREE